MSKYIYKLNISPLSGNDPKVFPYVCVQKDMHVWECEWSDVEICRNAHGNIPMNIESVC